MSVPFTPARLRGIATGLVLTVPLGLAACGGDSEEGGGGTSAKQRAASPQPTTLAITTSDVGQDRFKTEAPSSIKGGLVKIVFKNAGKMPHEAQLLRVDEGHTVQEALKILDSEDQKTPGWIHGAGGVGAMPPGQQGTTFINLPAGNYAVVDQGQGEGPSPSSRGALAEFKVTQGKPGALPQATATIVAKDVGQHGESGAGENAEKHGHSFEATGLKAGKNTVLFDNRSAGDEIHHAVLAPIVGDTSMEQVTEFLASEEEPEGPPPVDFENIVVTSVLDGQTKEVTEMTLRKGRYALLCFVSDRKGGKPHFLEGMLEEVVVN